MNSSSPRVADTRPPLRWEVPEAVNPVPISKFLPLLRQAVASAPERADLKLHLAKALLHSDQMAEIVDRLKRVIGEEDADTELLYCLGRAALTTGDYQLASVALQRSAVKGFGRAFGHLAAALIHLDRTDEALEAALQGLQYPGSDFDSLPVVAGALLDRGEAERLRALCIDLRARGAWGGWLSAVMASAAAMLGLDDEFTALVDRSRWFSTKHLAMPSGFNQRLAAELLAHKALCPLPSTKATIGAGARINQLQIAGGPLTKDLLARIREAVEVYVWERQDFADDPIFAHRPASVALNSWALAVHDDGHETWHIHPLGWISGVYYVAAPKCDPSTTDHPGAIEFGPHPFGRESDCFRSYRWRVRPEPGLLLLFPSYYAHRTWPTAVDDPRICVAFDINPSGAALAAE